MVSTLHNIARSVLPVPLPDEGEASSVWRQEKLKDFMWRAKIAGMEADPGIMGLLQQIVGHTQALEELLQQQQDPAYVRPWWQDGEYDDARADRANDEGVQAMAAGQHSCAFDSFTEAIRLCPCSAVYHCNRAAAALRVRRPDIAAEDAACAIERDAQYQRAFVRGGTALLMLKRPAEALQLFQRAVELDPSCKAASKGVAAATTQVAEQQEAQEQERAAAVAGARPALHRTPVLEQDAALQLLAATQMAEANPHLEAARCALVEALIVCGRYADAASACSSLLQGVDRQYLEAEVLWRQGDVEQAVAGLQDACSTAPASSKCRELLVFLQEVHLLQQQAQHAGEEGALHECIDACSTLLARLDPGVCTGLYCEAMRLRAEAHAARGAHDAALADLHAALAADGSHAACLRARAEAHKQLGQYTDYFLDVQRLSKVAPGMSDLLQLLEDAARLTLGGAGQQRSGAGGGVGAASKAGNDALALLGLTASATTAQIRRAYLTLAARHHPDKWAAGTEEERCAAEARFKDVQRAYELLTS